MKPVEELRERVERFRMLGLPGQPAMMHMGTFNLVDDLMRAVEELSEEKSQRERQHHQAD